MRSGGAAVWMLAIAVGFALPATAGAQETTGALSGRALLPDSSAADGVQVQLSGPFLQGVRRVLSDRNGSFRVLAVPPGEYTLRVNRIGFRPAVLTGVVVDLGRTTAIVPIVLEPLTVVLDEQRIEVSDLSIDPVRTTGGGTIRATEFAALPTERDYSALIPILPQVNISYRGDAPNVAGATGLENQYFIDGLNVSDPQNGTRATRLPYNFVRAVDVKTGGYEARYGRALGAVVSAVTYSGTNTFEMSSFAFVQPEAFSMSARPLPGVAPGAVDSYDVGFRVGGPIVRDRLWYSAAVNPRRTLEKVTVAGLGAATDLTATTVFAGKLSWNAGDRASMELSLFGDPGEQNTFADVPPAYTAQSRDAVAMRLRSGGNAVSLRTTFVPLPALLLEARLGRQWANASGAPRSVVGQTQPLFVDDINLTYSGGTGQWATVNNGRSSAALHATYSATRHTIVAGVEFDDLVTALRNRKPIPSQVVRLADGATWLTVNDGGGIAGSFHNRSPAIFLQDAWLVTDRLVVNAGVRWSQQALVGASGRVAQKFASEWQPRVGFSLAIDAAARTRVFGSYGRFYQTLQNNMAVLWFVDYPFQLRWYDADPRVPGANLLDEYDGSTVESQYATRLPNLVAENHDEVTLGYERLLGEDARLTVRAIHRALRSSFQFGWSPATDWAFGTPGKGTFDFLPPPKREYTAVEVTAEGSWRATRYRASYVFARLWGNYTGLYGSDVGQANPGGNATFFSPFHAINTTGYLPSDRRHVAKVSASVPATSRLLLGAFLTAESGGPINALSPTTGIGGPRFLEPRGSVGRTPALVNMDVRLTYALSSGGRTISRAILDLMRVGNLQGVTRVDENRVLTINPDTGDPIQMNSDFRRAIGRQPPMAVRLGLEVEF